MCLFLELDKIQCKTKHDLHVRDLPSLFWDHVTVFPLIKTSCSYNLKELSKYLLNKSWVWTCTPVIPTLGRLEDEESGFQAHSWVYDNLEASLGYMRPCANPSPTPQKTVKYRNKNAEPRGDVSFSMTGLSFLLCTAKLVFLFLAFHHLSLWHTY